MPCAMNSAWCAGPHNRLLGKAKAAFQEVDRPALLKRCPFIFCSLWEMSGLLSVTRPHAAQPRSTEGVWLPISR